MESVYSFDMKNMTSTTASCSGPIPEQKNKYILLNIYETGKFFKS